MTPAPTSRGLTATVTRLAPPGAVDLARRIAGRPVPARRVPRLRAAAAATARPRSVWVVTPDWDRPSGGVRKLYRTVDVLAAAGLPAAVVHERAGFRCTWFDHDTPVVAARDAVVEPGDVVVVSEVYGPGIRDLPPGIGQVLLNQNVHLTVESLAAHGRAAAAPYVDNPDLLAVAVVSEQNRDAVEYLFPGVPVHRIRWALDEGVYHPPRRLPGRRLAFMSRRRAGAAAEVLALLHQRGATAGWEVVAIDGRSEAEVAAVLRTCPVFLSFSEREGLGLPPLEAMACGCRVVGFDGFAGREFLRPPHAVPVPDGDVVAMAQAAEQVLTRVVEHPDLAWREALDTSRFALATYSPAAEREDLVGLFGPLVDG